MTSFRTAHPIDFDLFDKDTQNVLYIEDGSDQRLTLQVENASTERIQFNTIGKVSEFNYHLALRFRPGTLSAASLGGGTKGITLAPATHKNWEMLATQDAAGRAVIYLKSKAAGLTLDAGAVQTIVFNNVEADGKQGSRGTRVELLCDQMIYSDSGVALKANREIHLSVINHRGKKNIPLLAGFVGDNGVLNDGRSANRLTVRLSNSAVYNASNPDKSSLTFLNDPDETKRTKLIISFDAGEATEEGALGSLNDIKGIEIEQPVGWKVTASKESENPEWSLTPEGKVAWPGKNCPDGNQNFLDLTIRNIISDHPTGQTYLYIRYENIPGYWDGQRALAIEKRPLTYRQQTSPTRQQGSVGIDTPDPQIQLALGDNDTGLQQQGDGELAIYTNNQERIRLNKEGKVGIGTDKPQAPLSIAGAEGKESGPDAAMHITNDCILFGGNNNGGRHADSAQISAGKHAPDSLNIVGMSDTSKKNRKIDIWAEGGLTLQGKLQALDGIGIGHGNTGLQQQGDGGLAIHTNNQEWLSINKEGKVGIGNSDPKIQLALGDHDTGFQQQGDGELAIYTNNQERVRLNKAGKVGLGTEEPLAPLSIAGDEGKESDPDDAMHITNDCILFGGKNADKQTDSAQISAGKHTADSLNIVGMGKPERERKVKVYAEGGLTLKGSMGIGSSDTTDNTKGKLVIEGHSETQRINLFRYFSHSKIAPLQHVSYWHDRSPSNHYPLNCSIYASDAISANIYVTHSDRRIKKNINDSASVEDLGLINELRVIDYQYVDEVTKGTARRKGFIAQEVEKSYPNAVSQTTDFVPEVYALSQKTDYNETTSELAVNLKKPHRFKVGDEVRLIGENGPKEVRVTQILSDTEFVVSGWEKVDLYEGDQIFVYGKKVTDFKTVDYQELSVIAISAIQALSKENTELRQTVSDQQQAITGLTREMELLRERMAQMEKNIEAVP